ncbi:Endonuclease/exonuclease/phosphatase [Piromyces finnis]|uniref:sphingomyelin phosphodiesterase n=1 Tax=Piromyces finnis TaxID=1754191 RepID=A0A1Y1V2R6_9FUNG|nr:Endonuclease/exonuclease/phosphatase [Piromyces finnis]|eukprot:ORX45775.1 Endonuclease/exonuclease/phosphatase [Piromyces finnis]
MEEKSEEDKNNLNKTEIENNNSNLDSSITNCNNSINKNKEDNIKDNKKQEIEEKNIENVDITNPKDKVRILTYNIFMRPPPIHSFESDFKEDRIKLICKQFFQDYDVIAFQECFSFGSSRIDKIKEKAKKHGINYFSNSKKKYSWNIGIDGGLCLLSRFPVVNKKMYYFKNGCHSDAYSEKGVLFNEIEMPNGNHLFIFTSHTQASYEHFPDINSESVRVRLSQFTEIRKFITEMTGNAKPDDIVLLCGDLNVNGRLNKDEGKVHSEEYKKVYSILEGSLSVVKNEKKQNFIDEVSEEAEYKVEDLFYNKYNEHLVTSCDLFPDDYYIDGKGKKSRKCLDYFFKFTKLNSINNDENNQNTESKTTLAIEDLTVNTFDVSDKKFVHLSDHYGLSLNIVDHEKE